MSMFDKFKEIIGGSDYDEDFDDIEEVEEEEEVEEVEPIISKQRGNKVVIFIIQHLLRLWLLSQILMMKQGKLQRQ